MSRVLEASGLVYAYVGGRHAGPAQLEALDRLLQTPQRYARANRPLFKFCFVRHPLRWYESWFRFNAGLGWPEWTFDEDDWNPSAELNGCGAPTFDGFVEKVLRARPGFLSGLYDHYARDAHFVGRQERAIDDLRVVLTFLRATLDDERINEMSSAATQPELELDWDLQRALEEAERDAFTRYGYATSDGAARNAGARTLAPFSPSALLPGPFVRERGCAWTVSVPELARFADNDEFPRRSMLSLLENGMPLRLSHAAHDDVRRIGLGRFSHWNDAILFSTSDNSDPNETGRRYDIAWVFPARADSTDLLLEDAA